MSEEISVEEFLRVLRAAMGKRMERAGHIARRARLAESSLIHWVTKGLGPDAKTRRRIVSLCETLSA